MEEKIKSKIEKLERIPDDKKYYDESDFVEEVIEKINMIIDHLNSQDQEESEPEKVYVDPIVPDFIAEKLAEERYNTREILLNGTKPLEVEDTLEQKEEWEKKWEEFFLYVTNNKNWVDGRPEWKGNVYITLYNAMKDFIRQLLEEGERWAIDTFLKDTASYNSFHNGRPRTMRNGLSGEGFEVRVSKLNK